ncbi:DUF2029 domain-containing protein [Corynebacterium alimapuense]|uniref:DUF2029 domain-containing protein n=2 Tax=Corynebacterium alimapuense TaxID=1576874 RepID=A0A3M8K7Z0_9CORY|nr:DUF2029 domain-containing protein [Corynebacterium alimapuense]
MVVLFPNPLGDVNYYFRGVFGDDLTVMTEYPDAGVWPVRALGALTGDEETTFRIGFIVLCLLIDAAFLALLLRHRSRRRLQAGWFWVLFGTAVGPVFVLRLDLFPGLLVAAFGALLLKHPNIAAIALAMATAIKLWPGVLAAGLVGGWRRLGTWTRLVSFFGSLVALASLTVFDSGLERLLSPLTYQTDRGLQIESVAATPFLLMAHRSPEDYQVFYATSKSFEIAGPGTDIAVQVLDILMLAVLVAAMAWALTMALIDRWRAQTTIAFSVVMILLLIVTNKVFSPQYLVWIGPLLAVCLLISTSKLVRSMAVLVLISGLLGFLVYPVTYGSLLDDLSTATLALILLTIRNLLMVLTTVLAAAWFAIKTKAVTKPHAQYQ